jgi:hypothetical protein
MHPDRGMIPPGLQIVFRSNERDSKPEESLPKPEPLGQLLLSRLP